MRSKASFKSHPIHPMLVGFPITFVVAAPLFDLVGIMGDWPAVWTFGAYSSVLAVVTGLAASVPGFIDYLYVVPPDSSGKRRATYHLIVNVTALVLVAISWLFRDWNSLRPDALAIVLQFAALALMSVGGWLGGTLVYRNQIGVDHRYADAGKWREVAIDGHLGESVAIEGAQELKNDQMMLIHAAGRRIVLARTAEGYAAFDDRCTHRGASLADGVLACGTVSCPWHGSQFDVHDGSLKAGPAEKPIGTYRIEESDGAVRIVMPA
jgi:uncharacterized membrane protein/nitrite reductase/ring-hydroxylating ferredoxin subunit